MKITLDLDQLLQDQRITPDEAEHLKRLVGPGPHEVRTLASVGIWALLGLVLGSIIGATVLSPAVLGRVASSDAAFGPGFIHGSVTGLLVGLAGGVFAWAFLPYKGNL